MLTLPIPKSHLDCLMICPDCLAKYQQKVNQYWSLNDDSTFEGTCDVCILNFDDNLSCYMPNDEM